MKKMILTIKMVVLSTFTGWAQQTVQSNMLSIQLPASASRPNKENLAITQKKFHNSVVNENNKNIFQVDDILIMYQDNYFDKLTRETLESIERQFVNRTKKLSKSTVITDTNIVTINNVRMLIIKSHKDDDYLFCAYTDLYKNASTSAIVSATNSIVGGTSILVQCKKDDEEKAKHIFNDILKSVALRE